MPPGPQPPPRQVLPERGVQATPAEPTPAEPPPAPVAAERRLDSLPARPPAATAAAAPLPGVALLPNPTLAGSLPALTAPLAERPVPVAEPTPAGAPAPQSLPAPSAPLAMPAAPDASSQLGHDVATAPSQAASSPRLNLDLPRLRGGELSRLRTTGVLPVLPRPPELPDKLGREIEKAAKADCRNAYSVLGVLAVVPLAVDAVRQGGCKW